MWIFTSGPDRTLCRLRTDQGQFFRRAVEWTVYGRGGNLDSIRSVVFGREGSLRTPLSSLCLSGTWVAGGILEAPRPPPAAPTSRFWIVCSRVTAHTRSVLSERSRSVVARYFENNNRRNGGFQASIWKPQGSRENRIIGLSRVQRRDMIWANRNRRCF
jgi:hypothetical protein